jgi:hypothetical protein
MDRNLYDQGQAFGGVIDVLEVIGAIYAIWGGLAVVAYGEPRFTQDMDILLRGDSLSVELFVRRLRESSYHVDERAVKSVTTHGGFFNVIHLHYAIKTDFYVPHEADPLAMIAERVYLPMDEMRNAAYGTAESVIVAKLKAYLESSFTRHLEDIASIIRVQGVRLDFRRLEQRAAQIGAFGIWRGLWDRHRG